MAPTEALNTILCVTYVWTIVTPAIIDELTNSSRTNELNKKNVTRKTCFSHASGTFCVLQLSHNKRYGFRGALPPTVGGFGGFGGAGGWVGGGGI